MVKLSQEQLELLYESKRIRDDDDKGTPVVVDADAIAALRAPLEDALASSETVRSPEELSIEGLAGQFGDGDGRTEPTDALEDASQMPETGGAGADELGGGSETGEALVESLSPGRAREAYKEAKKIAQLSDRTPKHAETLREELADDLGVDDPEDLPTKSEFQAVLQD